MVEYEEEEARMFIPSGLAALTTLFQGSASSYGVTVLLNCSDREQYQEYFFLAKPNFRDSEHPRSERRGSKRSKPVQRRQKNY